MKEEIIDEMSKQIESIKQWMKDSSGFDVGCSLEDLAEDSGDIYEVIVDLHLVNGRVLTLNNNCKESFLSESYKGSEISIDDGVVYVCFEDQKGYSHQTFINVEHIVLVDTRVVYVDWKKVREEQNSGIK